VLFDFGGVILSSPFEAFNRYEADVGLPPDTIRRINATNPDDNAWAHFERGEVSAAGFVEPVRGRGEDARFRRRRATGSSTHCAA
jgi:putative hydrolase of the HAD superfamily